MPDEVWLPTLPPLDLDHADIHVWCVHLNLPETRTNTLKQWLSPEERDRASRFRFDRHRTRYIAGHGLLRYILGKYLNLDPARVAFFIDSNEKPDLVSESNPRSIRFNLSHSEDLALVGITLNRSIGVDVEQIRPNPGALQIAKRYFSTQEYEQIRSTPEHARQAMFFRFWTLKEACIKATGEGIGALEQVQVTLDPDHPKPDVRIDSELGSGTSWQALTLNPVEGYIGAVVFESPGGSIKTLVLPQAH